MKITIHRGINQIGGCITEIATTSTRILIDLGQNLPDNKGRVNDSWASSDAIGHLTSGVDAIFYSHYHGDHIGLFGLTPNSVKQYIGKEAKEVMQVKGNYISSEDEKIKIDSFLTFEKRDKIHIGEMSITPFLVSHSACDSYLFLIETEGIKILHTGDFRDHGYLGKGLMPTIKAYIKQVDFLITEGTMLARAGERVHSESELQAEAKKLMKKYKYLFILCSSTDVDRIATFYSATPQGRLFVCDRYQADVLDVFTANSGKHSPLFKFDNYTKFPKENLLSEMKQSGFCMLVRCNAYGGKYSKFTDIVMNAVPDSERLLIYSMWSGYLDNPVHQKTEYVDFTSRFSNVKRLHTSGHASMECLAEVCNSVNPRLGIIPIHSECSSEYRKLAILEELKSKIITSSSIVEDICIEIEQG